MTSAMCISYPLILKVKIMLQMLGSIAGKKDSNVQLFQLFEKKMCFSIALCASLRLVFTSDRIRVGVIRELDLVKIENWSRKQS